MCVCVRMCLHVALLVQHAMHLRHIETSSVAPQAQPHFSTLYHKRRDFRKQVMEHKMRVLIFYTTFV
jgi:hypothetical protein